MSFISNLGRWLEHDPIGHEGGDANLYRGLSNNPPLSLDPDGLFTYRYLPAPKFGGIGQFIGYRNFRLDIRFIPAKMPQRGFFNQVNTITTTVVTCNGEGELKVTQTVKWILDRPRLRGQFVFQDSMDGPGFEKDLAKTAILVVSQVVKEHGFVGIIKNVDAFEQQKERSRQQANDDKALSDKTYDMGTYEYTYLWADSQRPRGVNFNQQGGRSAAIMAILNKEAKDAAAAIKALGVNLNSFQGQMIEGDAGVSIKAGLNGVILEP